MKKCIIISDSFKGTLSSRDICAIAQRTVPKIFPECQVAAVPVADGGEGTVDCFCQAIGAERIIVDTTGPYGEPVQTAYARKGDLAIAEMAGAAGLPMAGNRRNPEKTTTYGVGRVIRQAVDQGCRRILLGLGGSCTNDGGCGAAAALGVRFRDSAGAEFVPVGGSLDRIASIDVSEARELLREVQITVMCDVTTPLYGEMGAAAVFAPQKGADEAMARRLDGQLRRLDRAIQANLGQNVSDIPGAGAAGGMGAGCVAFLGAELRSGIEAVLEAIDFDRMLDGTDLVITGEGRVDAQSAQGKVISGIASRTSRRHIPLAVIAGSIAPDAGIAYDLGVTAMFSIDREAAYV